jgi:hypothetical protein
MPDTDMHSQTSYCIISNSCPLMDTCIYVCIYLYIHRNKWNISTLKMNRNPVICNNMNKPGRHYVKWKKIDTKEKNTIWYYLCDESTIIKAVESESRVVVARSCRKGHGAILDQKCKVLDAQMLEIYYIA